MIEMDGHSQVGEKTQEIGKRIRAANRILVVSHIRPDGDAIGSLLGLGLSLQQAGKEVQMVLSDGVPQNFRHLEGSRLVRQQPEGDFDLVCVVDCSDLKRTGSALRERGEPDINIDHHITNLQYGRINLVDPQAVATAEILVDLLTELGLPFDRRCADALLTGLITDTLGFRTTNMTPKALRQAARLMELGADLPGLYHRSLVRRSYEAARFWGTGLSSLERSDRLAWTTLTMKDRKAVGYPGKDDADLVNILSSLEDIDIAVIFVEQPSGQVKVSWRAQPGFDVSQIALQFGGGGHPAAAGAEIPGSIESVRPTVLKETQRLLAGCNDQKPC
jgi:phosphoesterase RecJ-like protein